MDREPFKESGTKEEPDSGVDNASDSSHSDEDQPANHSDYEEELNSDNDRNSSKKVSPEAKVAAYSSKNSEKNELSIKTKPNPSDFLLGEEYREVLEFYNVLVAGQYETVDFEVTSEKRPEWFDEEKFKRGQKFAREHLYSLNFAEILTLIILFCPNTFLGPLIFTGKSDSPFKAFKRYLNTILKLISWYEDDIWNEPHSSGSKNLRAVRGMHKSVYRKMRNSSSELLTKKTTLGDPTTTAMWCPMKDILVKDFRESLPAPAKEFYDYGFNFKVKKVWISQADMSFTQFGFIGLAVTYPKDFGLQLASEEDLEGFIHMWRCLGYLLGIKDKYNFCNTTLEFVRLRTKFFLETLAKPTLRNVNCDWEHMSRCLTAGISYYLPIMNFESTLLYLCDVLKIKVPRFKKQITFRSYFIYLVFRLNFYLMRFRCVMRFCNTKMYELIRRTEKAPPDVLARWENKQFSYMNQPGKSPIREN